MLDVRLARLALPLPLELAIRRSLTQRERAAQHEGLVLAWELATRILAGSMWAACKHVGASSTAFDDVCAKLARPQFGHWVELARVCAGLLRHGNQPAQLGFRATLEGLEQALPASGGLRELSQRIAALPDAPVRPRRVQELLAQLPFYRNQAQSTHNEVASSFRAESVDALLEGLIQFCELVPLCGAFTLEYVGRLERRGRVGSAEIARLTGMSPQWSERELAEGAWSALHSSRPYLFQEPELAIPLFPMAAVAQNGSDWHVGWYAGQVCAPTVAYKGAGGSEFQVVLAPEELASLSGATPIELDSAAAHAALKLAPYRGLLGYDTEHAAIFFGREEETAAALGRIEERGALFVYGASGSGKSSWLRAGIVPALRARATLAGRALLPIVLVPGDRPLAALRRALIQCRGARPPSLSTEASALDWALTVNEALPGDAERVHDDALAELLVALVREGAQPVLLVDQLEEAALGGSEQNQEAQAFLALLAAAARRAKPDGTLVLASARADLFASLLEFDSMRAVFQSDGWPIGSIPSERLLRVVLEPLRGRRVTIEPGLPETILSDVGDEPGALALLSQVLTTLWNDRSRFGGALTKRGYDDAGRVSGALRTQAEGALAEARVVEPDGARHIDRLFRALATNVRGRRFARRRVKLATLASELERSVDDLRALAEPFVARHLLVLSGESGQETIEVAHERLFEAWPHLSKLLASQREVLDLRREISNAAAEWEKSGRKRELWSDDTSKLRQGEELLASGSLDLDARGRAFVAASRARVSRRRWTEHGMLALTACLAVVAGVLWIRERGSASEAKVSATKAKLAVEVALDQADEASNLRAMVELQELTERADRLWPADRQHADDFERWIADAKRLVEGCPAEPERHVLFRPSLGNFDERLRKLQDRALPRTAEEIERDRRQSPDYDRWAREQRTSKKPLVKKGEVLAAPSSDAATSTTEAWRADVERRRTFHFESSEDESRHTRLAKLVSDLRDLRNESKGGLDSIGTSREHGWGVRKRLAHVRELEALAASTAEAWARATESIANDPLYEKMQLSVQYGLVPLGKDVTSKLWEFADVTTGAVPAWVDGHAQIDENSGMVFVLLPPGRFVMGAPSGNSDGSNGVASKPSPPRQVGTFFLSKYELTQGQWRRFTASNPSWHGEGLRMQDWKKWSNDPLCRGALHPLEFVNWLDSSATLGRMGFELPTEEQWEYAARAMTSTTWWCGDDIATLATNANVRDTASKRAYLSSRCEDFDDGNAVHAEVGRYRANKFGLHDMLGNVAEWCADQDAEAKADSPSSTERVARGGSFNSLGLDATCASRIAIDPANRYSYIGVRPMRRIQP